MKDCVKDVNSGSSKGTTSIHQSSPKLINHNTIKKIRTNIRRINVQLNDIRKESRKRFSESKGKK